MHGADIEANVEAITFDPGMKPTGGWWRPDPKGPAANTAIGNALIKSDIEGQSRPKTESDIGADEVSGAAGKPVHFPLKASDVGVSFLQSEDIGGESE